jgi:pimeloyl-ACP methyl ester carboxylesterase
MAELTYSKYKTTHIKLSNGCDLAYIDEGVGKKVLLFIHGLATYSLSWKKNIDHLKAHYRCIALDLPGNGLSGHGNYPYGISFFADTVNEFIQKLALKDVCIVGHSMGSQIAMMAILKYPTCCNQLILCAPAGFETFTPFEKTFYHSAIHFFDFFSSEENSLRQVIRSSFYNFPAHANEMIDELVGLVKDYPVNEYRKMIESCIKSLLNEPVYEQLHQIKQPTLVLFGEYDALIPNKLIHHYSTKYLAEETIKRFPNATLKVLPQCGHFLQWEKAKEVNHLIEGFIG